MARIMDIHKECLEDKPNLKTIYEQAIENDVGEQSKHSKYLDYHRRDLRRLMEDYGDTISYDEIQLFRPLTVNFYPALLDNTQ